MILFWLIVCVMTAVALLLVLRPLQGKGGKPGGDRPEPDEIAMFRAQLAELDRDLEAGLIDGESAGSARIEIERRILRAVEAMQAERNGVGTPAPRGPHMGVLAAVAMIPVAAVALYMTVGHPQMLSEAGRGPAAHPAPGGAEGQTPSLEMMAQRLEEKLQADGGTAEGWALLARTNMALGRPHKAADAFRRAIALAPDGPAVLHSGLGEALTGAAEGRVTPEAGDAFEAARAKDAGDPAALYYLALAEYQQGRRRTAYDAWVALAAAAPADAPWLPELRGQIARTATELGLGAPPSPAPRRGPSAEDMEAVQSMNAEDRQAMIAGMVGGLAARLAENPDDAEGWRMLARSYGVLGRLEDAAGAHAQLARLRPRDAGAQLGHGLALVAAQQAQGKPIGTEAQAAFERALALDPGNPQALYYLGKAASQRGDREAAIRHWKPLLDRLPEAAPQRAEIRTYLDGEK